MGPHEAALRARTPATAELKPSASRPTCALLLDHEVPDWLRLKNIRSGYRPSGGSVLSCLASLFTWHNQTLNAWTMVLGVVLSAAFWHAATSRLHPTGHDAFVLLCPVISTSLHAPFSIGYHLLLPISYPTLRRWRALDITFIFVGSIPLTYALAYYALPHTVTLLLTAAVALLALQAALTAVKLPTGPQVNKGANTRFVGCAVALYMAPMAWRSAHDLAAGRAFSGPVLATLGVVLCLALAAGVYIHSFPEIIWPERFDLVGACQQTMHLAIVGAHIAEFAFVVLLYAEQHDVQLY